jgi:sulfopyruvate decarboxylase TPP-binding subunit
LSALKTSGTTHVVTVPDFVQFALHAQLSDFANGIRQIFACSEDQALTVATGLYVGGARPVVMVQNQGLYKCLNTLRATCIDSGVPVVFLVGQFGREQDNFGKSMRQSERSMVRLMEPLLDGLGLRYWTIEDDAQSVNIGEAFAHAYSAKSASIVLIARHVTWN